MEAQSLDAKLLYRQAEQVYDALSYYYEHADEIEQAIALNSDQEYWQEWLKKSWRKGND